MQHPEYVAVRRSKRSHDGFYRVLIGFVMGLFFMFGLGMMSHAEALEIQIIYSEEYLAKHPDLLTKVEIGIAPGTEEEKVEEAFPYSEEVPLSPAVQEYIWLKCKEATDNYNEYYYFMLGAIQLESSFKPTAVHHNSNGSIDRGLCQINSCNIKKMKKLGLIGSTDDLFDIYKNIDCGFAMMNQYINMFGVTESAYYAYNTGRERTGSNKNSRAVMRYAAAWKEVLT